MKTFFISFLFAVATIAPCSTIHASQSLKGKYTPTRDLVVRDAMMPQFPQPDPRSAIPTVLASYSSDLGLLEFSFTRTVGSVTISIVNEMGQCVAKYSCNTLYEPDVLMNVALDEGFYTIRIIGSDYEGEANIDLY